MPTVVDICAKVQIMTVDSIVEHDLLNAPLPVCDSRMYLNENSTI